jgi:hypothetical protein
LFRECRAERIAAGNHSAADEAAIRNYIYKIASSVHAHEMRINDMLFQIPGTRVVTQPELKHFLEDRINVVLNRLEMPLMFTEEKGVISGWFYQQLSTVKVPDFFATTQLQYTRNWAKHRLGFKRELANVY